MARLPPDIAVISDRLHRSDGGSEPLHDYALAWRQGRRSPSPRPSGASGSPTIHGVYLERLPLSLVAIGEVARAEIWDFGQGMPDDTLPVADETPHLTRRTFRVDDEASPFLSADMLGFVTAFGPPRILCVWGSASTRRCLAPALECSDDLTDWNSCGVANHIQG